MKERGGGRGGKRERVDKREKVRGVVMNINDVCSLYARLVVDPMG